MATLIPQDPDDLHIAGNDIDAATNIAQLKSALSKLVKETKRMKRKQNRLISFVKNLMKG